MDLEQLKKTIEFIRRSQHCTFEEALHEMDYVNIWDKAIKSLARSKESLNRVRASFSLTLPTPPLMRLRKGRFTSSALSTEHKS